MRSGIVSKVALQAPTITCSSRLPMIRCSQLSSPILVRQCRGQLRTRYNQENTEAHQHKEILCTAERRLLLVSVDLLPVLNWSNTFGQERKESHSLISMRILLFLSCLWGAL